MGVSARKALDYSVFEWTVNDFWSKSGVTGFGRANSRSLLGLKRTVSVVHTPALLERLILHAQHTFDVNTIFAGFVVMTSCALRLVAAVCKLERRLMQWQPRQGRSKKL